MVLILPLISYSFSLFSSFLGTIPGTPSIIGITVSLMFHSIFKLPSKIQIFANFFAFFHFRLCGQLERKNLQDIFFLLINTRFNFLPGIG